MFEGPYENPEKVFVPRSFYGVHLRRETKLSMKTNLSNGRVGDYNDDSNLGLNTKDVKTVREALAVGIQPESTPK